MGREIGLANFHASLMLLGLLLTAAIAYGYLKI
jgi:hypothetical protein